VNERREAFMSERREAFIRAAVEAGRMSEEQAEEWRQRMSASGDRDSESRARAPETVSDRREAFVRAAVKYVRAAVDTGHMSEEQGRRYLEDVRRRMAPVENRDDE